MPRVSVLIPMFNSADCISHAVESIQHQTFTDWEMLIINDFGSNDGGAEIVRAFSNANPRIRLIQADHRLGLSESLNLGIRESQGEYIARLDADDTALPQRLKKQVDFMDAHPEIGVCGTWQHHYGPDRDWVHRAPSDPAMCKARLLFWCDMCHSTLMLRKKVFISNNLFYDPSMKAEDFELWTRAIQFTELANIPEVLGEYKEDGTSITAAKFDSLHQESGFIIASTLKRIWGMELTEEEASLFNNWQNDYSVSKNKDAMLQKLKIILCDIWGKNQERPFFEHEALLQVLAGKWHWAKNNANWEGFHYRVKTFDDIFDDRISKPTLWERYRVFRNNNPSFWRRVKKVLHKLLHYVIRAK